MSKAKKSNSSHEGYCALESVSLRFKLSQFRIYRHNGLYRIDGQGIAASQEDRVTVLENSDITSHKVSISVYTKEQQIIFHPNYDESELVNNTCSLFYTEEQQPDYFVKGWEAEWSLSAFVSNEEMNSVVQEIFNNRIEDLLLQINLNEGIYRSEVQSNSVWDDDRKVYISKNNFAHGTQANFVTSSHLIDLQTNCANINLKSIETIMSNMVAMHRKLVRVAYYAVIMIGVYITTRIFL